MAMSEARKNKTQIIAVFGVGSGLGQAVARRYARAGYTVVLVARRQEPLEQLAKDLASAGATPQHAQEYMPLSFYTLLALVQEFLPYMLEQGDGAILTAQGASSVQGLPNLSGPGSAQAAQRNYLQSLHADAPFVGWLPVLNRNDATIRTANGCITAVSATIDIDKPDPHTYHLTSIGAYFSPN